MAAYSVSISTDTAASKPGRPSPSPTTLQLSAKGARGISTSSSLVASVVVRVFLFLLLSLSLFVASVCCVYIVELICQARMLTGEKRMGPASSISFIKMAPLGISVPLSRSRTRRRNFTVLVLRSAGGVRRAAGVKISVSWEVFPFISCSVLHPDCTPTKGREGNLVLVLSRYNPSVSCFGPRFQAPYDDLALQNLLGVIPATTGRKIFGPDGEPGVQVVLPFTHTIATHTRMSTLQLPTTISLLLYPYALLAFSIPIPLFSAYPR